MSRRKSKIISFLLTVIMIFNTMPTDVFAINMLDMDTKIDCTHQHDEDCGYAEAVEGAECTHTDENDCDHMDDCGYMIEVDSSECNHDCNEEYTIADAKLTDESNWEGCTSCSEEIPHMIYTTADLDKIRTHQTKDAQGNAAITGYFKLANDIVFTDAEFAEGGAFYNNGWGWTPIGHNNVSSYFTGQKNDAYFDGNNFAIENLQIDRPGGYWYNGLFATIRSGVVKNVTLESFDITADNSGTICGQVYAPIEGESWAVVDNVEIKNCNMQSISATKKPSALIIGCASGTISNITVDNCNLDGKAAWNGGLLFSEVSNCNINNILVTDSKAKVYANTGLIAGYVGVNSNLKDIIVRDSKIITTHDSWSYIVWNMASTLDKPATFENIYYDIELTALSLSDKKSHLIMGNATQVIVKDAYSIKNCVFNITVQNDRTEAFKTVTTKEGAPIPINGIFRISNFAEDGTTVIPFEDTYWNNDTLYRNRTFEKTLNIEESYNFGENMPSNLTYSISGDSIGEITNNGLLTTKTAGEAQINATTVIAGQEYIFASCKITVEPIYITFGEKDGENPNGTIEYPFTGVAPAFSNYATFYPATVADDKVTITPDSKSVDLKEGTDIVFIYNRGDGEKEYTSLPVGLTSNDGISVTVKLTNPNYRFVTKSNSNPSDTISEKVIVTTNEKQEVALKGIIEPTDDTLDYTGQGRSPVLDLDKISADGIYSFTVHFQKVDSETEYENTQIENKPAAELTNDAILAIAPSNVGEYVMIITGTGDTTYVYSSWEFAIANKSTPTGKPSYIPITTSGKTLNDAALNVGTIIPKVGSIKWVDNNGQELDGNTKVEKNMAYKWLFSPTDSKNYTDLTGSITLWESSTGGGESGGSTPNNPPRVTPDPINPAAPTIATINVDAKVSKEKATVILTEKSVDSAIKKAQDTAKKSGSTNGIAVEINANTGKKTVNELQVAISKSVQDKLIASGVKYLMIKSSNMNISMDSNTLKQLQTTLNGNVNVVSKNVDATKLSAEAKTAIGNRPTFDITITNDKNQKLTNLNQGQISIAIPFTLEKNEKIGQVFGVYLDPNGKIEWLTNSVYNVNDGQLEFATNHLSTFGVAYQTVPQLNDIQNHWAKDAIEFVTSRGLMSATSGNFQPDAPVTRGMMAMALGKLANVDLTQYKQTRFSDVQNDQNFGYYEWISEKNIMAPTNSTTFSANQTMSREEVAVTMSNYLKAMNDQLSPVYVDVPFADEATVSTAAQASVKQLRMAGILSSKEKNRFEPKALATRAQTAIMLQRFIERSILETSAQGWQMNDSGKWQYYEAGKAVTKSQKIGSQLYTFDQYGITATQPKRLMVTYIVKDGESLKTIAKAQNCSVSELARINNKTTYATLKTGEIIKVYA